MPTAASHIKAMAIGHKSPLSPSDLQGWRKCPPDVGNIKGHGNRGYFLHQKSMYKKGRYFSTLYFIQHHHGLRFIALAFLISFLC